jgi:hypothetical protein
MKTEWICTDPDNEQYGRQISERVFEFKELATNEDEYDIGEHIELTINLDDYTEEDIENVASYYYGSLVELKEQCGDSWEWILAESIFEQESGNY